MNDFKTIIKKLSKDYVVESTTEDKPINIDGVSIDLKDFVYTEVNKVSAWTFLWFIGTSKDKKKGYGVGTVTKVYDLNKIKQYIEDTK